MEYPTPVPPATATAAFPALGSGLGTLFGVRDLDPGGKAGEAPRAGGRALSPAHVPRSDPQGEGVISARRSGKRGAGAVLGGGGGGPSPARLGRGKRIRPGPFPRL